MTHVARVDGNAVVLIVYVRSVDHKPIGGTNVKSVSVVGSTDVIALGVVNDDIVKGQVPGEHAVALDGCIHDFEVLDDGIIQAVGVEELWLRHSSISTEAIPPTLSTSVNDVSGGTEDGDVLS